MQLNQPEPEKFFIQFKATRSQWKSFFDSLLWEDLRALLTRDYEDGVEKLADSSNNDINDINFNRGMLANTQYYKDLPAVIEYNFAGMADEDKDSKESEEELDENDSETSAD